MFTLKANQRITHWKKLKDVGEDVRDFMTRGALLGDKLGCVLFQCPPTLAYDADAAVVVPRHAAGDHRVLRDGVPARVVGRGARHAALARGVAWCVAETDEKDPRPEDLSWEPVGYLRLRKTEYTDDELATWAGRIQPALDAGASVFCYFKHEDEGASRRWRRRLEDILRSKGCCA